jgi:HlyD family secretion protein
MAYAGGNIGSPLAFDRLDMDVVRTSEKKPRISRRAVWTAAAVIALILTSVAFARLKPAPPTVDAGSLVIDTVQRGTMVRTIRGSGTLIPENVRWITAATDARVDRVLMQPGVVVTPDTLLIELSDPQQQQAARESEWQLRAAEAAYEAARAELDSDKYDRESAAARLRAEAEQARLRARVDADLEKAGLAAAITRQLSASAADDLARRVALEEKRVAAFASSQRARLATLQAQVEQARALNDLRQQQRASLEVRAGIAGVLQQVAVQAGQRVTQGTTLARVAEPSKLKAEIHIAETQAKDVVVGQTAEIDTRNGIVRGHVMRIDPAASSGTVLVDLGIDGPLPAGARPDAGVDATIELDRIPDAIFVTRPVSAAAASRGSVLRVVNDHEAVRAAVEFGRDSATSIEVRAGLHPGDRVIVSDDSAYQRFDRIRIQ